MSNKVTMKLISVRYTHFCFGFTPFWHMYPSSEHYSCCTAIVSTDSEQWSTRGWSFLSRQSCKYLLASSYKPRSLTNPREQGLCDPWLWVKSFTSGRKSKTQLRSVSALIPKTSLEKAVISLTRVPRSCSSPGSDLLCFKKLRGFNIPRLLDSY